jgi:hypothetical protein
MYNLFKSATFYIENTIYIFNKTSYLNEEGNSTEPSPSLVFPAMRIGQLLKGQLAKTSTRALQWVGLLAS